jgi:hypothetical protein
MNDTSNVKTAFVPIVVVRESTPRIPAMPKVEPVDYIAGVIHGNLLQEVLAQLREECQKFYIFKREWPASIGLHVEVVLALMSNGLQHLEIQHGSETVNVPFEVEVGSAHFAYVVRGKA